MPNTAVTALTHAVLMLIGLPSKGDAQFALYENVADGFSDPNLLWQSISTEGSFSGPTAEARRVTGLELRQWLPACRDGRALRQHQGEARAIDTPYGTRSHTEHEHGGAMGTMIRMIVAALVTAGALGWLVGPSHAQFVLYDNFEGGTIDPAKWQGFVNEGTFAGPAAEVHRLVVSGSLRLHLVSWGDDTSDVGSIRSRNGLNITQLGAPGGSGFITGLKARVTVVSADSQHCPANPETANPSLARAQLIAAFFNDGSSPGAGDRTGDILAVFELQKIRNGSNAIVATVNRCGNPGCSPGSTPIVSPTTFTTTWALDAPLTLKIVWNEAGNKVTFTVTDPLTLSTEAVPIFYPATFPVPPISDLKSVRLLNDVENCLGNRMNAVMDALFDNVNVRRAP
jgi:hypothetical protein